jgi:pimeloyl-ACP methyl ester carboxylesterase
MKLERAAVGACVAALGYESRMVSTRRGRVRVLEGSGRGDLPTIVLLHGLGSQATDYLPLLVRLRPHVRRVVAPDLPGHGVSEATSTDDPRHVHLVTLTEALDEVLDEPAVLFGNSLGGLAAIRYALASPSRVRGLFLASPSGAPSTPDEIERLLETLRIETHGDALRFLDLVLHAERNAFRHVMAWGLRRRFGASTVRDWIDAIPRTEPLTPEELARITAPVHLIWGRSERLLPATHLDFFRAHLPEARIEEPDGFAHSPQLDDVRDVTRRLLEFARCA